MDYAVVEEYDPDNINTNNNNNTNINININANNITSSSSSSLSPTCSSSSRLTPNELHNPQFQSESSSPSHILFFPSTPIKLSPVSMSNQFNLPNSAPIIPIRKQKNMKDYCLRCTGSLPRYHRNTGRRTCTQCSLTLTTVSPSTVPPNFFFNNNHFSLQF
jgi:hypothetical protein